MAIDDQNDPGVPIEEEPLEVEAPRRAASAQFSVEGDVGSEAALREAMDPANQSLADALRLSFRVLQLVILVLLVLFLVSGFKTVKKGQSGVMLRFGRIVTVGDAQALEPGLRHNFLPFPVGEFIIFDVDNRSVNLGDTFWPRIPAHLTLEQAITQATRSPLKPGSDGSVMTADGDLAHLKLGADYVIGDPVQFVKRLNVTRGDAERVVELALQRAVVHTAARMPLQQLVDVPADVKEGVRASAQRVLDDLDCGIELTEIQLPDTRPPLAIVKVYGELQKAREEARREIEKALQDAEQTLIDTAGPDYKVVAGLIEQYEDAQELGDGARSNRLLGEIDAFLESDVARGEVAGVILQAEAYGSHIELTLGSNAIQFARDLPAYRRHPTLFTQRRWLEAYKAVAGGEDTEVFQVPSDLGSFDLNILGSEEIQKKRRQNELRRKELESQLEAAGMLPRHYRRADSFELDESNPLLRVEKGKIKAKER